ncbi:MAG: hypothetical protein WBW37_00015, partial [Methyloceanibacter sp.]
GLGCHAASASTMLSSGFETTNRNEGRRPFGLAPRTADSNSLKALRFMVAMLHVENFVSAKLARDEQPPRT